MERLTVHVSNAKTTTRTRKNKDGEYIKFPVTKNTLAFEVNNMDEATSILEGLKEDGVKIKKHYMSNIN